MFLQVVAHQHPDAKTDRIGVIRGQPALDLFCKSIKMLLYHPNRQKIAGSPVVDTGQKTVQLSDQRRIIFNLLNQKSVEVIFLIILMGKYF